MRYGRSIPSFRTKVWSDTRLVLTTCERSIRHVRSPLFSCRVHSACGFFFFFEPMQRKEEEGPLVFKDSIHFFRVCWWTATVATTGLVSGASVFAVFAVRMTTNNEEKWTVLSLLVGLIPSLLRHLLLRFLSHFFSLVEQLKRGTAAATATSSSSSLLQFFSIIF